MKFSQIISSHKSTIQICGSIFLAIVGFYTGLAGGGIPGAIGFTLMLLIWGYAVIPRLIDDFNENPIKNITYVLLFIVAMALVNYLISL